jgi:hypothetical protein
MRPALDRFGPIVSCLVVAAAVVVPCLASEVGFVSILAFAGYEVLFVGWPGLVLERCIVRRPSGLLQRVAIAWPLGYALEIGAYSASSALGVRGVFPLYPIWTVVAVLILARRGSARPVRERTLPVAEAIALAGVAAAALLVVAAAAFPRLPLPGTADVTYPADPVWQVSLAAEAKHHWPFTDPDVSGQPLPYHVFVYLHAAAVSRTTGVSLAMLFFRLLPLSFVLLASLQLAVAARAFVRRAWVAPLAPAFFFLVGELDLDPWHAFPFQGQLWTELWSSPTFSFGLVFFIPALVVLRDVLAGRGGWVVLAVLLVGAEGAKSATVPVIAGALVLVAGWRVLRERRPGRLEVAALGLATAVSAVFYFVVWRAAGSSAFVLDPPGAVRQMAPLAALAPSGGADIYWTFAAPLGMLGRFGGLIVPAAAGLFVRPREAPDRLLVALFVAGLVPFILLVHPGYSQLYFADYGSVGAAILAAAGVAAAARAWLPRSAMRWVATGLVAWLAVLLLLALQNETGFSKPYTLLARVLGARQIAWSWFGYPFVLWLAAVVAGAVLWRQRPHFAMPLAFAAVCAVAAVGLLDQPLDLAPQDVHRLRDAQPLYDTGGHGLSRDLYRGLVWIRANTPADSVLAVDNHDVFPGDGAYFDYAAFAERRTFLGGWVFANRSSELGYSISSAKPLFPFPGRLRLQDRVFRRGDRRALHTLVRTFGVRYLLVDRANGNATSAVARLGRKVFANDAVTVYAVG